MNGKIRINGIVGRFVIWQYHRISNGFVIWQYHRINMVMCKHRINMVSKIRKQRINLYQILCTKHIIITAVDLCIAVADHGIIIRNIDHVRDVDALTLRRYHL